MNRRSILTKTGKGLMEATGKTSALSRDHRNILKEIDGKVSVSELMQKFAKMTEPELLEALRSMEREGYLREFVGKQEASRPPIPRTPTAPSPADGGEDLDFTAFTPAKPSAKTNEDARLQSQAQEIARQAQAMRAREEAAAKARAEAAARARAEAEHKARLSARAGLSAQADPRADDAQAKAQTDALDQARREAEERQRREAEEKARREAVTRAVIEAEQAAKREAEERVRREIEERTRRETEERARHEGEARTRREAEEKVKRDAEERVRRETEERARREIEERARREEEERPRREEELRRRAEEEARERRETEDREALERSLREQEENARREAEYREREVELRRQEEERARSESEEEARRAEDEDKRAEDEDKRAEEEKKRAKEEKKRIRAEEKAQAKAAKKARKAARAKHKAWRGDEEARDSKEASLSARELWAKRRPGGPAKQFAVMLLLTLIVAVAALPFVPLASSSYEKAAQAWLGEPVKIGTVNLTLLPIPQLKFEKVVIGKEHAMRVAVIKAVPVITSLLGERMSLKSFELEGATFPREFLPALLQNKGTRGSFGVQRVAAKGLKIDIPELGLPALDVDASLAPDGALKSVAISNAEHKLSVKLQPLGGRAAIEISSDSFPLPIGVDLGLSEFLAKGTVTRGELALSEAEARVFGGRLLGTVSLRWSGGWSMEGELTVRQMEAGKIAAPLIAGGTLQGKGVYSMKGLLPERLILNAQLEGNFTIQKGSITNVDMTRLLQGSGSGGGATLFSEMSGGVSADSNRIVVRQVRMAAGLLTGTGQGEMDPQKNLSGRMQIEIRARTVQARATLTLSGTLQNPQFRRSN